MPFDSDYDDDEPVCPFCKGRGYQTTESDGAAPPTLAQIVATTTRIRN